MTIERPLQYLSRRVSEVSNESDCRRLSQLIRIARDSGIITEAQEWYLSRRLTVTAWNRGVFAPITYGDLRIFKELRKHDLIAYGNRNYF